MNSLKPKQKNVGVIEIKQTASITALQQADRSHTTLVFVDAVEPNNILTQPNGEPRFPDLIELEYIITPQFKTGFAKQKR